MSYSEAEAEKLKQYTREIIDEEYRPDISNLRKKLDDLKLLNEGLCKKVTDYREQLDNFRRCKDCQLLNGFSRTTIHSNDPIPSTSRTTENSTHTKIKNATGIGGAPKTDATSMGRTQPTPTKSSETLRHIKNYNDNPTNRASNLKTTETPPMDTATKHLINLPKEKPTEEPEVIEIDSD